jgi:hypothetical protein
MSVLECIDKMELLSTFLDALAAKLLSPTSRKEATAISRDLKDAAKVNLTLALTIKANAQKCAPVGNLLYVHNRKAVAKRGILSARQSVLLHRREDSECSSSEAIANKIASPSCPTKWASVFSHRFVDVRLLLGCFWLLLRFLNPNSPPRQATVVNEGR